MIFVGLCTHRQHRLLLQPPPALRLQLLQPPQALLLLQLQPLRLRKTACAICLCCFHLAALI